MDSSFVIYLGQQALKTALLVAAPVLVTCITVGILISLFQAVTSIRDMSLTIAPKLIAAGFVTLLFSGWMLTTLLGFMTDIFSHIQNVGP
jgi:flagellar biosynthetic protein FliQ